MIRSIMVMIALALILAGCSDEGASREDTAARPAAPTPSKDTTMVSLEITPTKKEYAAGEPVAFEAVMTNRSPDTITINNRFLLGYEERPGFERDLYFRIFTPDGKRYDLPSDHQADIDPIPSDAQSHLQRVPPGDTVHVTLSLTPVYQIKSAGTYMVQAVYASEPIENAPGLMRGPLYSNMAECTIGG